MRPIHIIGGGLAGSEAAWQAANCGVPVVLHEMRPARTTAAHRTAHLAELVCSNSFRSDDASTNAVGDPASRDARARIDRAQKRRRASGAGGRRARRRSRRLLASRRSGPSQPSSDKSRPERDRGPAARRLGQCDHRDRPAHIARAGRGDRRLDGRRRARLFRRDRADRAPTFDRYGRGVDAVALRQGRAGRRRAAPMSIAR